MEKFKRSLQKNEIISHQDNPQRCFEMGSLKGFEVPILEPSTLVARFDSL